MKLLIQTPANRCVFSRKVVSDKSFVSGNLFFMIQEQKPIDYTPANSRLTFIRKTSSGSGNYNSGQRVIRGKALYKCACGKEIEAIISNAKNGTTKSCGCLWRDSVKSTNSKHGLGRHPLYTVYKSLVQRCTNPNNTAYPQYGGAGVILCELWRNSFKEFHDWCMANGWQKGLQVDKDLIPKKMGIPALSYSPEMCYILTRKQNANAKKNNRIIEFMGKSQNLCQWAEELGVSHSVIQARFRRNLPLSEVLTPIKMRHHHTRVNKNIINDVIRLDEDGMSQIKIGSILNIDQSTANRILNKNKRRK